MKISYNWLKQFINISKNPSEIAALLTDLGLEVEGYEQKETVKGGLQGVVVGEVITCIQHPNADRLKLTTVKIAAEEIVQIVCGAPNVAVGQKVPVATINTVLYDKNGEPWKIKKGKIRGEESHGMICAEDELGLGTNHDGIMILDSTLKIGTPLAEVFKVETDFVFEIGLTPNRSDAMSHFGVARDLRAGLIQQGLNRELITPSVSDFHVDERTLRIDVEVENKELVPRYCGISIVDVEVKESPLWIKNRLLAIGITPKNNIVDITNYVLHEIGQPLHAFDASKIKNQKIKVKTLEEGTLFTTLDGVERKLSSEDIMICDGESNPLCIGGVFGGLHSGVTENTTSIFLESAYFNPISIRKTAKKHGLNTDASFRFERGIDINRTEYALKRAALLIEKYANGKLASDISDFYPVKMDDFQVFLSYENAFKLIGQEIPKDTIKNILASLEIKINSETETGLGLTIPSYRTDVQREADIIEEILRVYGYNNIQFSHKLKASISFDSKSQHKKENVVANHLNSLGFYEIMSNSLTKETNNIAEVEADKNTFVTLLNPLSNDLSYLRNNLFYSGLESILYNINRQNINGKFFEFGKTYHVKNQDYIEQKQLALFVTGNVKTANWLSATNAVNFFYLKGVVTSILEKLGIQNYTVKPVNSSIYSEAIALYKGDLEFATIALVNQKVLKNIGIKQSVFYANFNWEIVMQLIENQKVKLNELPKYPEVKRDLALLLDKEITFEQLHQLAFKAEKNLLKEVDLFDVYEGENLPENKKSYALSFVLQDKNQTLTDTQIDGIMQKLQSAFETNVNAVLR